MYERRPVGKPHLGSDAAESDDADPADGDRRGWQLDIRSPMRVQAVYALSGQGVKLLGWQEKDR